MNVDILLKALDNDKNENLMDFTSFKIKSMNKEIIKELNLPMVKEIDFLNKLDNYKYIDEINDVKTGSYVRWIPLNNPNKIELTKGAIICDIKITNTGTLIICKNRGI